MARPALGGTKVPPFSIGAEKAVLGCLLRDPASSRKIRRIISSAQDFFRPEHGRLFEAIAKANRGHHPADFESMLVALDELELLGTVTEDEPRLRDLVRHAPDEATAIAQAKVVREKASMRALIDVVTDILHDAYGGEKGYRAVLAKARERLEQLEG